MSSNKDNNFIWKGRINKRYKGLNESKGDTPIYIVSCEYSDDGEVSDARFDTITLKTFIEYTNSGSLDCKFNTKQWVHYSQTVARNCFTDLVLDEAINQQKREENESN